MTQITCIFPQILQETSVSSEISPLHFESTQDINSQFVSQKWCADAKDETNSQVRKHTLPTFYCKK